MKFIVVNKLIFSILILIVISSIAYGQNSRCITLPRVNASGNVYEKLPDGSMGRFLSGVEVEFSDSFRGLNIIVRTDAIGRYTARLPDGDYKLKVNHSSYIVNERLSCKRIRNQEYPSGIQKFTKKPKESGQSQSYETFNPPPPKQYPAEAPGAPEVSLSVSPARVQAGQPFTVTVSASDDKELQSVWWRAKVSTEKHLMEPQIIPCTRISEISHSWEVIVNTPGTLVLTADARDSEYSDEQTDQIHQASMASPAPEVFVKILRPSATDSEAGVPNRD